MHARQNGSDMSILVTLLSLPNSMLSALTEVMSRLSGKTSHSDYRLCWPFSHNQGGDPTLFQLVPNQRNTIPMNLLSNLVAVHPMFQNYTLGPNWHKYGTQLENRNVF